MAFIAVPDVLAQIRHGPVRAVTAASPGWPASGLAPDPRESLDDGSTARPRSSRWASSTWSGRPPGPRRWPAGAEPRPDPLRVGRLVERRARGRARRQDDRRRGVLRRPDRRRGLPDRHRGLPGRRRGPRAAARPGRRSGIGPAHPARGRLLRAAREPVSRLVKVRRPGRAGRDRGGSQELPADAVATPKSSSRSTCATCRGPVRRLAGSSRTDRRHRHRRTPTPPAPPA